MQKVRHDSAALSDFYRKESGGLLRYAYGLTGEVEAAQDLLQEMMARLASRGGLEGLDDPQAFARKIITNLHVSAGRRRSAFKRVQHLLARSDRSESLEAQRDLREAVLQGLDRLPPRQRAAIVLRYYAGCTESEIAQILDCAGSSVRSHIRRGLRSLRRAEDHFGQRTGDAT